MPKKGNQFVWIGLALVIVILDLASKYWVTQTMDLYESIEVLPFFNLTLLHNPGAAFSFLADKESWGPLFLLAISSVVSVALVVWLWTLKDDRWMAISLALILGGAVGNLYDRATLGYVVDFLDFHWSSQHFPAFNIADSAITVGAVMMFIDMFRSKDENTSVSKVNEVENRD